MLTRLCQLVAATATMTKASRSKPTLDVTTLGLDNDSKLGRQTSSAGLRLGGLSDRNSLRAATLQQLINFQCLALPNYIW